MRSFLLLLSVAGCSLGRVNSETCSTNEQCKSAFGWDSVCGDDGYCVPIEPPDRCLETIPSDLWDNRRAYDEAVVIGSLYSLGYYDEVQGYELPFREMQEDSLLVGNREAVFLFCDVQDFSEADGSPYADRLLYEEAIRVYSPWLAKDVGVPALLGPDSSDGVEWAYSSMLEADTEAVIMASAATSLTLTQLDGSPSATEPGLIWRSVPSDTFQGTAMARFVSGQLGLTKAAVMYPDSAYGLGLKSVFFEYFNSAGGQTTTFLYTSDNLAEKLDEAGAGGFEAIVFIGQPEDVEQFVPIVAGNSNVMDGDTLIVFADGAHSSDFLSLVSRHSDLAPKVVGTAAHIIPNVVTNDDFKNEYKEAYGVELEGGGSYPAYAYDAAWLVLLGAAWSQAQYGDVTPFGIGEGLHNITKPLTVTEDVEEKETPLQATSWIGLQAQFQTGNPVNVVGATGALDYDSETGETSAPMLVWTVVEAADGSLEFGSPGYYDSSGTFVATP